MGMAIPPNTVLLPWTMVQVGMLKKGECDFYDFNFWRRKCGHDFAAFIYGRVLIPEPNGTQLLD